MKLLSTLATIALASSLPAPAFAEVQVKEILVNQSAPTPENTNIRINMINPSSRLERISSVQLQVRDNDSSQWHTIKTFQHHLTMLAGKRLALDYLPAKGTRLDPSLLQPSYQLRAVVRGPNEQLAILEDTHVASYAVRP